MRFSDISAIDVHGHYGRYIDREQPELVLELSTADAAEVARWAENCRIEWTVVSPFLGLFPRGGANASAGNLLAHQEVPRVAGLLQYVIVNPLQPETYDQARRMLRDPWCVGIKIHPEEHGYQISDHGEALFSFFEDVKVPVMTHSGCPNSLPAAFLPFADKYPQVRLLLAHLGNGAGDRGRVDLQVRAVQSARHGNVWVDTSSARSILPGLVEWAVKEIGAERLLFGTDTPLYHVGMQRARIETAEISHQEKRLILRENALQFFGLTPQRLDALK